MTPTLKVLVIMGTTRRGRYSDKPASWIMQVMKGEQGVSAELIDLREWNLPFFDDPVSPSQVKDGNYENPTVKKWAAKIAEADGYIIVTAEYNHGYPAVLKNALDSVYAEWNKKPVAFVGYGSAMGARSIEQLREVAVELQMAPIRNAVHLPWDVVAATNKLEAPLDPSVFNAYDERAKGMIQQLLWWTRALKVARSQ